MENELFPFLWKLYFMKTLTTLVLTLLTLQAVAQQISGNVQDKRKQPIGSAIVLVTQNGMTKGSTTTDNNGHYSVGPLSPGNYDMSVLSVGYDSVHAAGIVVTADKPTVRNFTLRAHTIEMQEVTMKADETHRKLKNGKKYDGSKNIRAEEYAYDKMASPSAVGGGIGSSLPQRCTAALRVIIPQVHSE